MPRKRSLRERAAAAAARTRSRPAAGARTRAIAALSGGVLTVSPFLPWYSTDLGAVFTDGSASGWGASGLAKLVVLLGLLAGASALVLALDAKDLLDLGPEVSRLAAIVTPAAAIVALVLIAFRAMFLPGPDEFLTLDWGIYVAAASAGCTAIAGYVLLMR